MADSSVILRIWEFSSARGHPVKKQTFTTTTTATTLTKQNCALGLLLRNQVSELKTKHLQKDQTAGIEGGFPQEVRTTSERGQVLFVG